jgi:hypothetical protein
VQTLAATLAYAKKNDAFLLNTGDLFDFSSDANVSCVARAFSGRNILSALGNHESRGWHSSGRNPGSVQEDDALRSKFEKAYGHSVLVASRVVNGVNFVAFDNCGLATKVWQYFIAVPDMKSAGVKDGKRYEGWPAIIRAVNTVDAMTATIEEIPYSVLHKITDRITNEVEGINRVLLDLTPKPIGTIEWEQLIYQTTTSNIVFVTK